MFRVINKIIILFCFLVASSAFADDIDLINAEQTAYDANILLIMDVSGSMDWESAGVGSETRISVLRTALTTLLNDPEVTDINFGLSSFAGDLSESDFNQVAHGISYPAAPIDTSAQATLDQNPLFTHSSATSSLPDVLVTSPIQTTRDYLQTIANTWSPFGGTPIVDALFEAALYFKGLPTNWGRHDPTKNRAAHPSTYVGLLEDTTTTTTGQQCNDLPCTGASCNATAVCETTTDVATCSTPICGDVCGAPTTVTETCGEGITSCGSGLNCVDGNPVTELRNCLTNNPNQCIDAAADDGKVFYDCNSIQSTVCATVFGIELCAEINHQQCKEDIFSTVCDADSYECTTVAETCQHEVCEEITQSTTVLTGEAVFVSPIKEECPANGIILLSDGAPTVNLSADIASDMMGAAYHNNCDTGTDSGRCGPEIASFLANSDNSTTVSGNQKVNTFTVGMSLQNNPEAELYLKDIAAAGDGEFINASTPENLAEAFKLAVDGIVATRARSFTAPTYSIDTSTLLSHNDSIYVPIFDRKGVVWPGNLKKYGIENGVLKDINGDPATDSDGALMSSARDLWSTEASEDSVRSGGAANRINPSTRVLLTENTAGTSLIPLDTSLPNSLFDPNNGVFTFDDVEKQKLVTYIRGTDPDTNTVRNHMGDIIHSKPVKLTRADGTANIFVGSNEGLLHAINDSDGTEAYAYMPRDLLKNIYNQYHKVANDSGHIYGVDGPITLWLDERGSSVDKIGNNILDTGEEAYLFFGLRRGGNKYYALNVTNPSTPTLEWVNSYGLGDSWSQPVVKMLKLSSTATENSPVLIIGGGHNDVVTTDGNAVHVISALNATGYSAGDEIWSTKTAESTGLADDTIINGVPARIRVLDYDRNGSIDRLYFGDTGGNIWRVDLDAGDYSGNASDKGDIDKAKLYKVAELGGTGADNRKFFEEPDVAIFRQKGSIVTTIAIGSGDRTNPLESVVENHFYVLYDRKLPTASDLITMSTTGLKSAASVVALDIGTSDFRGWYKSLASTTGEKVLAPAVTYQNLVLFTTFGTVAVTPDACSPSNSSSARFYIVSLISGEVYTNVEAAKGEILGTPQIYFKSLTNNAGDGPCVHGDCMRKDEIRVGKVGPFAIPNAIPFQVEVTDPVTGDVIPNPDAQDVNRLPRVYWIDNE